LNVTRDVITDLIPLYVSGEASADSRALVETFLAQDPEFARWVNDSRDRLLAVDAPTILTKDKEMKSLETTKRTLRWHGALFGFAIFLSFLPFGIHGDARGVRWLWTEFPAGAIIAALLACVAWAVYFALGGKLRISGP
jgi:anti-sigma factor RsiW